MKTKIKLIAVTIIISVVTIATAKAQVVHSHWKLSTVKISDCVYDLVFTVTLDKGWHTFSITKMKDDDEEVSPTEINFKSPNGYSLVGNLTETKPTAEYDPTIKRTVMLHYNKAVFTQRIKLSSADKIKINGTYENQTCDNERCDKPPVQKFNFDLQGTTACSK